MQGTREPFLASQPEANPKGQIQKGQFEIHDIKGKGYEQVKAISTLRTGRQFDNKVEAPTIIEDSGRDEPIAEKK